jgi:hypothetical protein
MLTDNSIINALFAVVVWHLKQSFQTFKKINMKKLLAISLVGMVLFTACKKDHAVEPSLIAKWTVETIVTKEYRNAVLINTNTEPGDGYKYDFQTNGNLVISGFLTSSTHPYSILPNSKVDIDGDIFEIRDLTTSQVTLFFRQDYVAGEYDDLFINLKR